ncbi:hypothetical protein GCM10029963_56300 [Micromonospora andamanensis]
MQVKTEDLPNVAPRAGRPLSHCPPVMGTYGYKCTGSTGNRPVSPQPGRRPGRVGLGEHQQQRQPHAHQAEQQPGPATTDSRDGQATTGEPDRRRWRRAPDLPQAEQAGHHGTRAGEATERGEGTRGPGPVRPSPMAPKQMTRIETRIEVMPATSEPTARPEATGGTSRCTTANGVPGTGSTRFGGRGRSCGGGGGGGGGGGCRQPGPPAGQAGADGPGVGPKAGGPAGGGPKGPAGGGPKDAGAGGAEPGGGPKAGEPGGGPKAGPAAGATGGGPTACGTDGG